MDTCPVWDLYDENVYPMSLLCEVCNAVGCGAVMTPSFPEPGCGGWCTYRGVEPFFRRVINMLKTLLLLLLAAAAAAAATAVCAA